MKRTIKTKIIGFYLNVLIVFLLIYTPAHAQASENSATMEIFNETGAKLLITEVNFKNKLNDWVELYYQSPAARTLNLKGFQFEDDNVFKKIETDYFLTSNQYYILKFKSNDPDNQPTRTLATTRSGLTGTTEQIMIKDPNNNIVDAVCWSSAKPTSDESKDMQKLFQNGGWVSADPASCFNSAKVATNQSIARMNFTDTNSVNDWAVTITPTPGTANTTTVGDDSTVGSTASSNPSSAGDTTSSDPPSSSSSTTTNPADPSQISDNGGTNDSTQNNSDGEKSTNPTAAKPTAAKPAKKSTAKPTTKKSAGKSSTIKKYKNGDLSSNLIISEILPHPAKDQRNNEWIELTNTGNSKINMGNWGIGLQGKTKHYILADTVFIQPGAAILIKSTDSKLSLTDAKGTVQLFDPTNKLMQSVDYQESPKDQSYVWITINKEDGPTEQQWTWDNTPTPGEPNPPYYELTGTITGDVKFQTDNNNSFILQTSDQKEYTLLFNETLIAGPLAKATFTNGTTIKTLGIPGETTEQVTSQSTQQATLINAIQLKKYEVLQAASATPDQTSPWFLFGFLPPGGAGFWYGIKKIRKIYGKIQA